MNTLPKSERLRGKVTISALMSKGRWGFTHGLKYCFRFDESPESASVPNRMMVSVPKRLFKRAVKRNLLKRRIREAYRTQKDLISGSGAEVLFIYNTDEMLDSKTIRQQVETILTTISNERQQ